MSKFYTTMLLPLSITMGGPALAQKKATSASPARVGSQLPCVVSSAKHASTAPAALPQTTGSAKLFKLTSGDPGLPKSAHPGGDEVLSGLIDEQNAHNPAHGGGQHSAGATGGSNGSGGGGTGGTGGSGSGGHAGCH